MIWGWGWSGMIFGPLFMILMLAVLIAIAVLLVRWIGGPWQPPAPPNYQPPSRTPLDILKERFGLSKPRILLCGTCMEARGLTEAELVDGARRSTIDELSAATAATDKLLVF